MAPKVFFITGTSTGFGAELVKTALAKGDKVVATARNSSKLSFDGTTKDNYLAVDCDVTDTKSIDNAFEAALKQFGRVDVVSNNAGYGLSGEFESLSENQIRTQMEINYFGLINVTRRALETMREKNNPPGGHIQQVTSIGGLVGVPCFTIYCSSKFAVEGFTDALRGELKGDWNIKLTCIEPGPFRTDWAGRSMDFAEAKNPAYDHIDAKERMEKVNGQQAGDPARAAGVMWEIAGMQDPPPRLVLGAPAYNMIIDRLKQERERLPKYEKMIKSADFPESQSS